MSVSNAAVMMEGENEKLFSVFCRSPEENQKDLFTVHMYSIEDMHMCTHPQIILCRYSTHIGYVIEQWAIPYEGCLGFGNQDTSLIRTVPTVRTT